MTPDERQLIADLFDRMRANGAFDKDREAESFINQAMRQSPDASYMLVQSVLAQEMYLQQAAGRVEELEARLSEMQHQVERLESAQSRQPSPAPAGGGSFLGGLFGGGRQPEAQPAQRSAGSVPAFGGGSHAPSRGAAPAQAGSPWGQSAGTPMHRGATQRGGSVPQAGAWGGQQPQQPAAAGGGGFMRSALTTAAGVAGGMMAANALSGLFNSGSSANAATPTGTPPASEPSPFDVNNSADQQRANEQQDLAQDAEFENEQHASLDDGGDWGSSDDSEY